MNILITLLKNQIKQIIEKQFNVENVQILLSKIGTILKEKAETTETGVDDWVVSVLCKLVSDSDLAAMLVDIVQAAIVQTDSDGNVILHDAASCKALSERLAEGLEGQTIDASGEVAYNAIPWTEIVSLIKVLSTILSAWAQLSGEDE